VTSADDRDHRSDHERLRIGYAECVDLPEMGIAGLRAKVDTGARTSALHVDDIERLPGGKVRFFVVLNRKTNRRVEVVEKVRRVASVRPSSGHAEERIFVATELVIGDVHKEIEVSLAARHGMQFRMLLGRRALAHDFLIDAGRRYLQGRRKVRHVKAVKRRRSTKKSTARRKSS
jgi:hypothetical protein